MQMKLHPDRFNNKGEKEVLKAESISSRVNHAYKLLRDPVQRAVHILELHGYKGLQEESQAVVDPEILMESMEKREELEELKTEEELKKFIEINLKEWNEKFERISSFFSQNSFEEAQASLLWLKYQDKLIQEAKQKLYEAS